MDEYYNHDLDYPWRLYFNGQPMPRWANCWSQIDLLPLAKQCLDENIRFAGYLDVCSLHYRMDLAHTIESEDPELFRIVCLTLLSLIMRHEAIVLQELATSLISCTPDLTAEDPNAAFQDRPPYATYFGTSAQTILSGIQDGLVLMHQLAQRDGFAFWSVGYEADQLALNEAIRRFRLPLSDPDHIDPPHIRAKRSEASEKARLLRKGLVKLLGLTHRDKELRRFIHQLPTSL